MEVLRLVSQFYAIIAIPVFIFVVLDYVIKEGLWKRRKK